ncbi:MAG TPA: hypothetical protein VIM61_00535 [Chthoniobacterales bacterium]
MKNDVAIINMPARANGTGKTPCFRRGESLTTVSAAPGEKAVYLTEAPESRRSGVFTWQKLGDGTFAPVVRIYDTQVPISEILKLVGISYDTIRRLITAGFVDGSQPSPGRILVSIDSLFAHLEATKDPDFWTPERVQKFRAPWS